MGYAFAVREGGREYGQQSGRETGATPSSNPEPAAELDTAARAERIDELSERLGTLVGHIHAGMYRYLEIVAELVELEAWEWAGHRTPAHWLSHETGFDLGTCREHLRVARALEDLPVTSEAMSHGELSFSKVRALTRAASPETEADLVEVARSCTTSQLEHMMRAFRKLGRTSEAALAEELHRSRKWSLFPDHEGMYVADVRLEPEVAALLSRAVDAASDELYRERRVPRGGESWSSFVERARREAARLRADAIGLVAERALAAGFGGGAAGPEAETGGAPEAGDAGATPEAKASAAGSGELRPSGDADASGNPCSCGGAPISGTRAERYQVVLHVEPATLASEGEPGRSELADGTRVSAETSRRLACDAGLVRVGRGGDGSVLDVGRRTRTIPPALRRALEIRDRGCRFPGCGHRFTDGHHIRHWADGGETSLANTVLLCGYHHRLVHEGGWTIMRLADAGRASGRVAFQDPRGQVHHDAGWRPGVRRGRRAAGEEVGTEADGTAGDAAAGCAEDLIAGNRRRGIDPGADAPRPRWKWESLIPEDVLERAREALL